MKRLFVDPQGRLALFWRLFAFLFFWLIVNRVQGSSFSIEEQGAPLTLGVQVAISILLVFGLTYLFRTRVDLRPWGGMALPVPAGRRAVELLAGFVVGASMLAVVFLIEWSAGWVSVVGFEITENGIDTALRYLVAGLFFAVAVGFIEELAFRGYFFQNLGERLPVWTAVLLMSMIFALLHYGAAGFSLAYVVGVVIISAFFVQTRLITGTLWFAVGWHTSWLYAQSDVLGLATAEEPRFEHALLHVEQNGPALLVGVGTSIEGGLVAIGVIGAVFALTLVVWRENAMYWLYRLDEYGRPTSKGGPR